MPQKLLHQQNEHMLRLDITTRAASLLQKIDRPSIKLGDLCYVNYVRSDVEQGEGQVR